MNVIKKPVITEKYTQQGETQNKYAFICDPGATKNEIKKEVERIYDVEVTNVNTMIFPSKKKTRYTKTRILEGKTSRFKKAVVQLKKGSIDFYSNI